MGKCGGCQNEILKGHKFCGKCGLEAKIEAESLKCVKCQGETLKSHAFCPACGVPQAGDEARFKGALDLLGTFALERVAFDKAHGALPTIDVDGIDLKSINDLLAANTKLEDDGDGAKVAVLDMGPVVTETLKSLHALAQQGRAGSEFSAAHFKSIGEGMLSICGALGAMAQRMEERFTAQDESIKGIGGASRGRRAVVHALERPGGPSGGEGEDKDDVHSVDIRVALGASLKSKDNPFSVGDVSVLTELTNAGMGLKAIRAERPALAAKVVESLKAIGKDVAAA